MSMEQVELTRDCYAIQIPSGFAVQLHKGDKAVIMQALGGSFTVQVPSYGCFFRIAALDADAIGRAAAEAPSAVTAEGTSLDQQVWAQLKTCYDPEIPVNIVDLGLIYDVRINACPEGGHRVDVTMTLTAPGCGMGTAIAAEARQKLMELAAVQEANVEIVWEPPWSPQMISPEGKERLGMP
jgi:probable FeS assembly SUF system protein SufT